MGDRTQVILTVLKEHEALVQEVYKDEQEEAWDGDTTVSFTFQDIDYGNLYDLAKLKEMGIAYDSQWLAGCEYGEGCEYLRFTPEGDPIFKEQYVSEKNPPLNDLLALLDSPEKLREYILAYKEKIAILPWDNQGEYGKIYRTKQLICKE